MFLSTEQVDPSFKDVPPYLVPLPMTDPWEYMDVSKLIGVPKMDGLFHGKPY